MFKKYLYDHKISIYKLSEISNIPYTTLNELVNGKKSILDCKIKTIDNLSKALNMSIETLLHFLNNKNSTLSCSWEDSKNKLYYFPVVIENRNYECNRIHPLMQSKINNIYNAIASSKIVKKVIVFGSSVNIRCNKKSDIDIAILLKDDEFNRNNQNSISEEIQEITEYNSDIIWLNTLDSKSKLYENIINKGVVIYE